ncbi:transposase family protein [Schlesneria paludicola]
MNYGPVRATRREQQWRHLDGCRFATILHVRIPRVESEHGVKQLGLP